MIDSAFKAEREQRKISDKTEGLRKFLDEPLVRMVISSLGIANPEPLNLLLSAAFDAGFDVGAGSTAGEILDAMMRHKAEDEKS